MSGNSPTTELPRAVDAAPGSPFALVSEPVLVGMPAAQPVQDTDFPSNLPSLRFLLFRALPSWVVSMLLHMVALLLLALIQLTPAPENVNTVLAVGPDVLGEALQRFELPQEVSPLDVADLSQFSPDAIMQVQSEIVENVPQVGVSTDLDAAPLDLDLAKFGSETAFKSDLASRVGVMGGTGLEGRGSKMRGQLVARHGGTKASEEAVALALEWLTEHQLADGSWSFDHRMGRCAGRCGQPGELKECFTGGTAMGLLPLLGAGQTHVEGQYRNNVRAGLTFLVRSMQPNGSLIQPGGSMYAHGLSAISLCEAYAMTNDRSLLIPAQASLNFIAYAQDPVGGGWRYVPHQSGDTSVVGWQLMALKSGNMAYLGVSPRTIYGVSKFLDSVQTEQGAKYGYNRPGAGNATTAIGLLCRMYLGWKKDNDALRRGIEHLSRLGPSPSDMYYNYYATQVIHHYGGNYWEKWNQQMRELLVKTQSKTGHMRGSWDVVGGGHSNTRGGRLYFTSMATMILEVYYRHLPIYQQAASEDEFPL